MTKPITARAIEPNAGIRRAYARKLLKFHQSFVRQVFDEIFLHLAQRSQIALDWNLSGKRTHEEKQLLEEIGRGVLASYKRDPDAFQHDLEEYVAKNVARWIKSLNSASEQLALWVARGLASSVSAAQRRAYQSAGIPSEVLKQRWNVPIVRQFMSPTAEARFPTIVKWATELITQMAVNDLTRIQQVITTSFTDGQTVDELRKTLSVTDGFNYERAYNVALDQSNKISQAVLQANDEDLGIEYGVWIHVPGKYTSRASHKKMNGKRFRLDQGMYDPEVGEYVLPAQCPYCRCVYRPVIDWKKLASNSNE